MSWVKPDRSLAAKGFADYLLEGSVAGLDAIEKVTGESKVNVNDLVWSFIINNYLLGKAPLPFDLFYWNSDSTRMPGRMHSFYWRVAG